MRIVITGAGGYIANLVRLYNKQHTYINIDKSDVNFEYPEQVKEYFEKLEFDAVLHCAANISTAACENEPEATHNINCKSAIAIADICKARDKRFIFFSTEQCFNGKTVAGPFKETDVLESVSAYGIQKVEADEYISANLTNYVTLRLSWLMGLNMPTIKTGPNILKNALLAVKNKQETAFAVHEIRGLTYGQHIANNFDKLLTIDSGVYHFSSENKYSTYESARYVAKAFGYDDETVDKYIKPDKEKYADRPRDYRLANEKINSQGITLTTFEDDVAMALADFGWE